MCSRYMLFVSNSGGDAMPTWLRNKRKSKQAYKDNQKIKYKEFSPLSPFLQSFNPIIRQYFLCCYFISSSLSLQLYKCVRKGKRTSKRHFEDARWVNHAQEFNRVSWFFMCSPPLFMYCMMCASFRTLISFHVGHFCEAANTWTEKLIQKKEIRIFIQQ